jgi:hypothetical protein
MRSRNAQRVSLPRRHPASVTADRLGNASETYFELLTDDERTALGLVKQALEEIAEGTRPG